MIVISLSVWILLVSNGMVLHHHLCNGKLKAQEDSCLIGDQKCCSGETDCCNTILEYVDTDIQQVAPTFVDLIDIEWGIVVELPKYAEGVATIATIGYPIQRPPPESIPLFILHESFLL